MKSLILLILLSACATKPVANPAFYASKVAKPLELKSLITPGFY